MKSLAIEGLRRRHGDDLGVVVGRAALGSLAVNLASAGITFALHVLLSRTMGVDGYGVYIYAFTWIAVLALGAKLGLDTALVRFLPALEAKRAWPQLKGLLRLSTRLTLAAGVGLGVLFALGAWALGQGMAPEVQRTLWLGCLLLPVLALTHLRQAALRGLRRVPLNELPDRILRPALMIALIFAAAIALDRRVGAETAMIFHLAALVAVFLLAQLWLAQALPPAARSSLPAYRTREWLGVALPLVFISAMHLALSQIDILMVGILLTPADAGVYAAAARIGAFVIFGLIAVNGIVAPMIARLFTEGHRTALQHMVTLAGRAGLAFALVAALALAVFGDWILSLFGPAFPKGYGALLILVAGQLINAFAGSVGFLMTMTGHERQAAKIMLLSLALNILLNAVLIPVWGLEGAATATAITTALWNLAMLGYVKRRLGIHSSAIRWS